MPFWMAYSATTDHSGIEIKFIDVILQDTVATAVTDSLEIIL